MGVYIPPGRGIDGSGDNDDNDKKNSLLDRASEGSDKILFYTRPNVGLKIWGPLVPASDYLPGLYGLTALQTVIALVMIRNVRRLWGVKTVGARLSKAFNSVASGYLVFNSGLEFSRLTLPYDPWYDEAREARLKAEAEGKNVNFWFGPWDFKPMTFHEWNKKVDLWILKTEQTFENQGYELDGEQPKTMIDFSPASPILQTAYMELRESNKHRNSEILQQLANRDAFKNMLPSVQTFSNFAMERPALTIPEDNHMEDDYDLDEFWELNDPWVGLGVDTDYSVRFIPKFRWIDKLQEANKRREEYEQTQQQRLQLEPVNTTKDI